MTSNANYLLNLQLKNVISPVFFSHDNFYSPPYKVLTSHSCSEEGLEDAANILLQLSRGDGATRDTVLRLLLSGARHLGYTLCKQIGQCWETAQMPLAMLILKRNLHYATHLLQYSLLLRHIAS